MSRILGLDLGQNSIGWAIINDNEVENFGLKVNLATTKVKRSLFIKNYLNDVLIFARNNIKIITLTLITGILFILSFLYSTDWQFWLSLGISSLVATLTFSKK